MSKSITISFTNTCYDKQLVVTNGKYSLDQLANAKPQHVNNDASKTDAAYVMPFIYKDGETDRTKPSAFDNLWFDFDGKVTVDQVIKELGNLSYWIYTSFSHLKDYESHRFRVVIPLSKVHPISDMKLLKPILLKILPILNESDPVRVVSTSGFFAPCTTRMRNSFYQSVCKDDGECLEIPEKLLTRARFMKSLEEKAYATTSPTNTISKDTKNDERVVYYMKTRFPKRKGNGNGSQSLWTAMCTVVASNDLETLETVMRKALTEKWTLVELQKMLNKVKLFVYG